ncbi:tryptophan--tRNA ligase [candidate division CPR3 bacterium 4484_211]|uniref:Tryptophan--tRNA ligase n=1 Tax=candidate division CPR3 bacterium 4484_211 TaxID=1968527 RepID=A0A1W9NXC0_UNCC3|nr:MAG: tryptophan--tRNA ligase [candidate division CPR3 bacterium 4484_211]
MSTKKPAVFSGVAPSGSLHIGNYIGAIRHWVEFQDKEDNIFCVVDLHAITTPQDPRKLKEKIYEVAALYLACGINPDKSKIFVQSHNPDHAQLAWILNCVTPIGWMRRMTQFKDKSQKQKEIVSMGLFDYPVLMAADILLYQTNEVPVGEDQKQHVEITRDIARRFNSRFGEAFTIPKAVIDTTGARIMSLQNPLAKMSKSDPNPDGSIFLLDDADAVQHKIRIAVTDSGKEVKASENKPALKNLLTIYSVLGNESVEALEERYQGVGYREFKADLAEVVIEFLRPIQKKYREIWESRGYLDDVLRRGLEMVRPVSHETLARVRELVGLG